VQASVRDMKCCVRDYHSGISFGKLRADRATFRCIIHAIDRPCGLVVRVLGCRSGGPGSIPGTTRFSGKKKGNISGSGTGSTQPREYN
jgi:hypothetical protein